MLGVWGGVVRGSMRSDISVSGVESFGIDLLALSIDTALNFEQDDIGNWTLDIRHWTLDAFLDRNSWFPYICRQRDLGSLGHILNKHYGI